MYKLDDNTFKTHFSTTECAILSANTSHGCMQEPLHVVTVRGRLSYIPSLVEVL